MPNDFAILVYILPKMTRKIQRLTYFPFIISEVFSLQSIQLSRNKSSWVVTVFWWLFLSNHWTNWAEILHVPISAPSVRIPKIFEALPGFFFAHRVKKSLVELQKLLGNLTARADIGTCKISARLDKWFPQKGPVTTQLELLRLNWIDCTCVTSYCCQIEKTLLVLIVRIYFKYILSPCICE